jgi:molybdopterin synthase sulfur carrier subunit
MKILYFAWLRERLNKGEEEVSPPAAIDAKIVPPEASIAGAGVVALFPPMTGG